MNFLGDVPRLEALKSIFPYEAPATARLTRRNNAGTPPPRDRLSRRPHIENG